MLRFCYCWILCTAVTTLSSTIPWPYHQIYPPMNDTDGRSPLHFALVLSFGGSVYQSIGVLPGVQMALDYINSEPSILPGYSLHYTLTDSQVCLRLLACFLSRARSIQRVKGYIRIAKYNYQRELLFSPN